MTNEQRNCIDNAVKKMQEARKWLDAIQSCIDRHEDGRLALEAIILTIDELKKK